MANLYFEAQLDADQLKRELRDTNRRMTEFAKNFKNQGAQIDSTFKRIGQAMAGYFSITAAKGFMDKVIKVRGEFQQLDIALDTMLGNKEKADKVFAQVVQLAAKTPFSLTELGQGAKQLIAFKQPADEVASTLRRIGDIAAGVSVPVGELISAYGKVSAKGKMQAEELNQFAERGVPIISELAKVIGTTDDKIYKMAEQGKIKFGELQAAIKNMTDEGGQFFNLMEKQAGSLPGMVSNLGDAWDRMLNKIGTENQGILERGISGLTYLVEHYEKVVDILKVLIATYGTYRGVLALAAMGQKAQALGKVIKSLHLFTKGINSAIRAQVLFNSVTKANVVGLMVSAIAAVVSYLAVFNTKTKEATERTRLMASISGEVSSKLEHENSMLEMYKKKLAGAQPGSEQRVKLIKELNKRYPDLLKNIDAENASIKTLQGTIDDYAKSLEKTIKLKVLEDQLSGLLTESQNSDAQFREGEIGSNELYRKKQSIKQKREILLDELEYQKDLVDYGKKVADLMRQRRDLQAEIAKYESFGDIAMQLPETKEGYENTLKQIEKINKQIDDILSGDGDKGGKDKPKPFDLKAYKKQLSEQQKAYEEYYKILRTARTEDQADIEKHNSSLLKQGKIFEDFLLKQLDSFKDNVAAKAAIYGAAANAGVMLNPGNYTPQKVKSLQAGEAISYSINTKELKDADGILSRIQDRIHNISLDSLPEMGAGFMDVAYMLQDVSKNVGQFDSELGSALGTMGDLSGYAGQLIANLGKGGSLTGAISGVVGVVSTLASAFSNAKSKQEEAAKAAENFRQQIELQNRALERQIELMNQATGEDRFKAESESLELVNSQIEDLIREAAKLDLKVVGDYGPVDDIEIKLLDIDNVEELINALEKSDDVRTVIEELTKRGLQGVRIKDYDKLLDIIDSYDDLIEKRRELMEGVVGTTTDDIADSIIEGFRQGESAAEAFGKTFEDIMTNAIIETFKNQYIQGFAEELFDKVSQAMDPKTSPGLTEQEIKAIKTWGEKEMASRKAGWEAGQKLLEEMIGEDGLSSEKNSLTGAVKGVSEETASLIGGQMNAIRINQAESLRIMNESIRYQSEIAANTRYNVHLENLKDILSEINSIKSQLKKSSSDPLRAKGL